MKAIILVGGYGTRLRPLTISYPKSVFPFANMPMVEHQIKALSAIGVSQVIIAINYQAELIKSELKDLEQKYKITLIYSQETAALGTAGPIKLAEKILKENNKEGLFFVFNSDIICDYPLQQLVDFHKSHKKSATIVLASVEEPSRFGVVVTEEDGTVSKFVEKPNYFISNKINAGIYLLNTSVIDMIPERFCMIEKQIFPNLANKQELSSLALPSKFWFDIGKPGDYIIGQGSYLQYYKIADTRPNVICEGNVFIHESSKIEEGCKIGPNVVIGPGCTVQAGCRLADCTLVENVIIGKSCFIKNTIISWRCQVGDWVRIQGLTVIAEDVKIKEELNISQCMILSKIGVNKSCKKQTLMM